jgi:DNA/RNA endonuclease YhcR with UshA esterase domain
MRLAAFLIFPLLLAGCATSGSALDDPTTNLENAERSVRTEANGDVIEEYRVAGQLQVVKVTPSIGVTYYLIDNDGDGRVDATRGNNEGISPVYYKLFGW